MQSENPTPNTPQPFFRRGGDNSQSSTTQGPQFPVDGNVLPVGGDHTSHHQPIENQSSASISNQLIDLTASDEEDADSITWTQISGPSNEDMSDSDESSLDTAVQYQIPTAIQEAEKSATDQVSGVHKVPEVHRRYNDFALALCKETATEVADQHVLKGLPVAIVTARSIRLDKDTADNDELDVYAFALVIHIWQLACIRMQHGRFPPEDIDVSLCLSWTAYLLSAHTIVETSCKVSFEELRYAVMYWEDRLRLMGGGNRWAEDTWAKDINQVDQDAMAYRNETADRYMKALERNGKEGVGHAIIEEERKGDWTQLRTMTEGSPEDLKIARRQIASMLYSMETPFLKALIQGQLPRLAEIESGTVYEALRKLNEKDYIQPGIYMSCICDFAGFSPTPKQWGRVCNQMLRYVQYGGEYNDLAAQIDQQIHPKSDWPKDLDNKGLRRYTEWRSYMENGNQLPDTVHRKWVRFFVDQLKMRMKGLPIHAPLSVPVVEIGFSNDPDKRLRQHRHHESSNYLMNLAEAVFAMEYPGSFRLQQKIVFACYREIQTWLSEIIITHLSQGYVEGGGGFSHEPAGRSNTSSNKKLSTETWTQFEALIYEDGRMEAELEANSQKIQGRRQAKEQQEQEADERKEEADPRKQDAEAARRLHTARVTHLRNLIAVEEARQNLLDHFRRG